MVTDVGSLPRKKSLFRGFQAEKVGLMVWGSIKVGGRPGYRDSGALRWGNTGRIRRERSASDSLRRGNSFVPIGSAAAMSTVASNTAGRRNESNVVQLGN